MYYGSKDIKKAIEEAEHYVSLADRRDGTHEKAHYLKKATEALEKVHESCDKTVLEKLMGIYEQRMSVEPAARKGIKQRLTTIENLLKGS